MRPTRVPRFRDPVVALVILLGVLIGLAPIAVTAAHADPGADPRTATYASPHPLTWDLWSPEPR